MPQVFYPGKGHGFANTLIHLCDFFFNCPDGLVHESIKDYEVGEWIDFLFPLTDRTDLPEYKPGIYINQFTMSQVHPMIRKLIRPSQKLQKVLDEKAHLVKDVRAGVHVRRGASSRDSRSIVQADTDIFANDWALQKFQEIVKENAPVFLASDSPETKKFFRGVKTLDTEISVVHDECPDVPVSGRRNIFVDFFLLSQCPLLFLTGGNFPNPPGLSTFGYMAAMYGGKRFVMISNQ